MEMTNNEIVRSYQSAKKKRDQIKILADLNCTTTDDIKEILKNGGVNMPGGAHPKKAPEIVDDITPAVEPVQEDTFEEVNDYDFIDIEEETDPEPVKPVMPDIVREVLKLEIARLERNAYEVLQTYKLMEEQIDQIRNYLEVAE